MDSNPKAGIVNLSVILLVIKFGFTKATFWIFILVNFIYSPYLSKYIKSDFNYKIYFLSLFLLEEMK